MKWLVGVDEAGRGPLAGPVSVGIVCVPTDFDWSLIPNVNDSKQLSEKVREDIFKLTKQLQKSGLLTYSVHQVSASIIDNKGISYAIKTAMSRGLNRLVTESKEVQILLDGSLHAPDHFPNQTTIIKGDAKEPVIGLASIMAKVTRDRYMEKLAKKPEFAVYDLAQHKGYGTKRHRENIKKYGLSLIHRKSFCSRLLS